MQRLLSHMRKAIEDFNMIEDGDKIAVCLSGGKDSISLLMGLRAMQRFYPKHYDIIAVSVNPGFDFFDTIFLQNLCDGIDVPLFIENSNIKEIVFDVRKEKNPCSLCANLRRGIINTVAIREHCNKIALGHNKDDLLENNVDLIVDVDDEKILTDSKWLEFILNQIINNSIKYKRENINSYIKIKVCEDKNSVKLFIEDNGIGIPKNDLGQVFDKCFTGENGREKSKSTGMGLYIAKKLCVKLGHRIEIESEAGSFTRAVIAFGKNDFYKFVENKI